MEGEGPVEGEGPRGKGHVHPSLQDADFEHRDITSQGNNEGRIPPKNAFVHIR